MALFNEIWSREPILRLGKLSQSVHLLHGNRMRFAARTVAPLTARDFHAATPVMADASIVELEIDEIINPDLVHPSYAGCTLDRLVRSSIADAFPALPDTWVAREVAIWRMDGHSWSDVEEAQRRLMAVFNGSNEFTPDDMSVIMEVLASYQPPILSIGTVPAKKPRNIGFRGPRPINLDGDD